MITYEKELLVVDKENKHSFFDIATDGLAKSKSATEDKKKGYCHNINYGMIADGIVVPINAYIEQSLSLPNSIDCLKAIRDAVFVEKTKDKDGFDEDDVETHNDMIYNIVSDLIKKIEEELGQEKCIHVVATFANEMLRQLNSCTRNLRYANPHWEALVGDSYDPKKWIRTDKDGVVDSSYKGLNKRPTGSDWDKIGKLKPNTYYIYDYEDMDRIHALGSTLGSECTIKCYIDRITKKHFICSTSNRFEVLSDIEADGNTSVCYPATAWTSL